MGVASSRDIARIRRDLSSLRACLGESVDRPVRWSDEQSVVAHSAINTLQNSLQHLQSAKRNATPHCSAALAPWRVSSGQQRQRTRARRVSISPEPPADILGAISDRAPLVVSALPGAVTVLTQALPSSRDPSPKEDIFMEEESTLRQWKRDPEGYAPSWWPSSLDYDVRESRVWPHPAAPKSAVAPAVLSAPMDICAGDQLMWQDGDIAFDICEILTTGSPPQARAERGRETNIVA